MKKLLYAAIVAFLFVGGLAAGVIHKGMQAQKNRQAALESENVPGETPALSLADLSATTPTEGAVDPLAAPVSEQLNLTEPTALAAAPTPEPVTAVDSGRSFGGGSGDPVRSEPVRSSGGGGSSDSSFGGSDSFSDPAPTPKSRSRTKDPAYSDPVPRATEITGTIIDETPAIEPVATPRRKGGKATPTPAPIDDETGMPVMSEGSDPFADTGTAMTGATDPFASTASAATPIQPATPDPFAAATPAVVAFAAPSGGPDLVFGAASKRPALVKVTQKQNGASTEIMIELAGSARYKVLHVPKRRQVWVDFEGTEVPGGGSSVGGQAAHIREISAKFFANEGGGASIARVIVSVDDAVLTTNDKGKEALSVTPGASTGETSKLKLTIGAKSQSF